MEVMESPEHELQLRAWSWRYSLETIEFILHERVLGYFNISQSLVQAVFFNLFQQPKNYWLFKAVFPLSQK